MNKNLPAFFLAAFTVSAALSALICFLPWPYSHTVHVTIRSDKDVASIVTVIKGLHRPDLDIQIVKLKNVPRSAPALLGATLFQSLNLMFNAAIVGVLYKFYCRKLAVSAIL